jgi:hypothetical protein
MKVIEINFFSASFNMNRIHQMANIISSEALQSLQGGEYSRYFKIAATCKHFLVYDMECWNETTPWEFDLKHVFVMRMLQVL